MGNSIVGSLLDLWPRYLFDRRIRIPIRFLRKQDILRIRTGIAEGFLWRVGSGVHDYWIGNYEETKQAVVRSVLERGATVFDIGANAGFYTIAMSRIIGPEGHVYAFEPFCENVESILFHTRVNKSENCTVVQCAVAERPSITGFVIAASNAEGAIGSKNSHYYVPTVSIDSLVESEIIPPPDVMKIDVEGAEDRVLAGARNTLNKQNVKILLAVHGEKLFRGCLSLLTDIGYRVYDLALNPVDDNSLYVDELFCCRG